MKITKRQLRRIIKEEKQKLLSESKMSNLDLEVQDNLGGGDHANETLFENLVRFLSGDTLDDFVDDYCRHNGMVLEELEEPDSATDFIPIRQELEDEDDESAEYCAPV